MTSKFKFGEVDFSEQDYFLCISEGRGGKYATWNH